jgi:hypothetical protein
MKRVGQIKGAYQVVVTIDDFAGCLDFACRRRRLDYRNPLALHLRSILGWFAGVSLFQLSVDVHQSQRKAISADGSAVHTCDATGLFADGDFHEFVLKRSIVCDIFGFDQSLKKAALGRWFD